MRHRPRGVQRHQGGRRHRDVRGAREGTSLTAGRLFVGAAEYALLLGDVRSLKQKRAVVRPLVAALRRLDVSVAEVGDADLHRRALIGVAVVSGTARQCGVVLDACDRLVGGRPEVELLASRRRTFAIDDRDDGTGVRG